MEQDGRLNVHNEPIIYVFIVDSEGNNVLDNTIDISGKQHTTKYLQLIAEKKIDNCENNFKVVVG